MWAFAHRSLFAHHAADRQLPQLWQNGQRNVDKLSGLCVLHLLIIKLFCKAGKAVSDSLLSQSSFAEQCFSPFIFVCHPQQVSQHIACMTVAALAELSFHYISCDQQLSLQTSLHGKHSHHKPASRLPSFSVSHKLCFKRMHFSEASLSLACTICLTALLLD